MIRILTIIGARPQIIKSAAINRAISNSFSQEIEEIIVHTGQHYDSNMSAIFFDELNIPTPNYNLNVGSGSHASQTGLMLEGLEKVMITVKPDYVLVYGDTNSTLAGALAASKVHIPVVHVEAGLRSFNKTMPEEINRIVCDHASTLLFTPTIQGYNNLLSEGFQINSGPHTIDRPGVFQCGDVMYDNSKYFADLAAKKSRIIEKLDVVKGDFILATIHRADNTDDPNKLRDIFRAFIEIVSMSSSIIILPLHPRTLKKLEAIQSVELQRIRADAKIILIDPVSFLDMIELETNCSMVITDSGGVQKEAYFFGKPCIILRTETEWIEIINTGSAILTGSSFDQIVNGYSLLKKQTFLYPEIFGDGRAAEFICEKILQS